MDTITDDKRKIKELLKNNSSKIIKIITMMYGVLDNSILVNGLSDTYDWYVENDHMYLRGEEISSSLQNIMTLLKKGMKLKIVYSNNSVILA